MVRNEKGFSLIELMIVVGIIGILAAIAIPNYTKFQLRAKQSEAKSQLSGLFSAEKAFSAEYSTYSSEFDAIGFLPEGQPNYNVGYNVEFDARGVNGNSPDGNAGCKAVRDLGGCKAGFVPAAFNPLPASAPAIAGAAVNATGFTAVAISDFTQLGGVGNDTWTMDNNRVLTSTNNGL